MTMGKKTKKGRFEYTVVRSQTKYVWEITHEKVNQKNIYTSVRPSS